MNLCSMTIGILHLINIYGVCYNYMNTDSRPGQFEWSFGMIKTVREEIQMSEAFTI